LFGELAFEMSAILANDSPAINPSFIVPLFRKNPPQEGGLSLAQGKCDEACPNALDITNSEIRANHEFFQRIRLAKLMYLFTQPAVN
jgi:hypothetical protein